jgi:hypothetical protein
LTSEGAGQSVTGTVTDKAGNSASATVSGINIDKTAPITTITIGIPEKVVGSTTYVSVNTTFSLGATDNLAEPDQTKYGIDAPSTPSSYTVPFPIPSPGTHTIYYRSTDKAGNQETTQSLTVVVGATALTYSGDTAGQYSDPMTLKATLIELASGNPIPGKNVIFTLGSQSWSAATNSSGVASLGPSPVTILSQAAGSYTVKATFAGDGAFQGISDSKPFTINKETVVITYTGDTSVFTAGPTINKAAIMLSAKLTQEADYYPGDLTLAKVTFELTPTGGGPKITVANIPVSAAGVALTTEQVSVDDYFVLVTISSGNSYWTQSEIGAGILDVVLGTNEQRVTGGGWIPDSRSANGKDNFGFTVNYNKNGAPKGNFLFMFRNGTDGYNYQVKSNSWAKGGLSFTKDGTGASFTAKCTVQKIDRITGIATSLGGDYTFVVNIKDGDLMNPRTADTFAVIIFDSSSNIWIQVGTGPGQITLAGGNIVVHSK